MERFLALCERLFHRRDETDVLVDGDAEGEDVLLRLAFVELSDPDLDFT